MAKYKLLPKKGEHENIVVIIKTRGLKNHGPEMLTPDTESQDRFL